MDLAREVFEPRAFVALFDFDFDLGFDLVGFTPSRECRMIGFRLGFAAFLAGFRLLFFMAVPLAGIVAEPAASVRAGGRKTRPGQGSENEKSPFPRAERRRAPPLPYMLRRKIGGVMTAFRSSFLVTALLLSISGFAAARSESLHSSARPQGVEEARAATAPCVVDATTLCLNASRFRVNVTWANPDGTNGSGQAVGLTSDTGYFWFFSANNVEMVIKVVDGRPLNSRFWVFAGGLTNVRVVITVTDTQTGVVRAYTNPQGTAFQPIQDTAAFTDSGSAASPASALAPAQISDSLPALSPLLELDEAPATDARRTFSTAACASNATALCLNGGRFRASVTWTKPDGTSGAGQAVGLTADTGYFWFFSSNNVEMVLKVVDGRPLNQRYWVFAGGLTNVQVVITVADTEAGTTKIYTNPQGTAFQPVQDTAAFSGTPILVRSTADRVDDRAGYQIKLLYVLPSDGADRALDTNGTLTTSFAAMQRWLSDQSGGTKFQADTFQGSLDIGFARLSQSDATIAALGVSARDRIESLLPASGYSNPQKIYAVFYDGGNNAACAGGPTPPSLIGRVSVFYLRGTIPGATPCSANPFASTETNPGYVEFAMTHEVFHALGAVPSCAPHYSAFHVNDDPRDLMYAGSLPWNPSILDVNHDDYWGHGRAGCTDISKSVFLNPTPPGALVPPGW